MRKTTRQFARGTRRAVPALILLAIAGVAARPAPAATIDFGAPANIAGPADVLGAGTPVYAYDWANVAATVNGVAFVGTNSNKNAGGNVLMTGFAGYNATAFNAALEPFSALNATYRNLLIGAAYGSTNAVALNLRKLAPGHRYALQFWVGDPRTGVTTSRTETITGPGGSPVTLDYNTANAGGGVGQYTVGRFTADATNQAFTIAGNASTQVNALQLRDVTGSWSGTASDTWDDATTNFSGLSFDGVKALTNRVCFADTDAAGNAVAATNVTVQAAGVTGAHVLFQNETLTYTLSDGGTNGIFGAYSLKKSGAGALVIGGTNTYSGGTTVNGGRLVLANRTLPGGTVAIGTGATLEYNTAGAVFNPNTALTYTGAGALVKSGPGTLTFGTATAVNINVNLTAGARIDVQAGTLIGSADNRGQWASNKAGLNVASNAQFRGVEANVVVNGLSGAGRVSGGYAGTKTLTVGITNGVGDFAGVLENGGSGTPAGTLNFTKRGTGAQKLSGTNNTYSGVTTFAGGVLNVASVGNYGQNSSLGNRAATAETTSATDSATTGIGLHFKGGTLQYTGATPQSTDRQIRILNGNGATIDASGSVPSATLSFTHTGANTNLFDTPGTRTLTLTGSNTGDNRFAIKIEDQAASKTSLTKAGAGTWVLAAADSTFSGNVTVSAGILKITTSAALGAGTKTVNVSNGSAGRCQFWLDAGAGRIELPAGIGFQTSNQLDPTIVNASGTNRIAGPFTMSSGGGATRVAVLDGRLTLAGNVVLNASNRSIWFEGPGDGEASGILANGATNKVLSVVKNDGGTWTLSGRNTYTGGTVVNGGVLRVTAGGSLGAGAVTVRSGAVLELAEGNALAATTRLSLDAGGLVRIAAGRSVAASVTVNGAPLYQGTWGSSTAVPRPQFVDNAHFAGGGLLHVTSGPTGTPGTVLIIR